MRTRIPRAGRRVGHATLTGMLVLAIATACAPTVDGVCPAIGYLQSLAIQVTGDGAGGVAEVLVCDADGCDGGGQQTAASRTASASDRWSATLSYYAEPLTVRMHGADGTVLGEESIAPRWVRTGGTATCGGPSEASVAIVLG
ncbi:MAG: hypothetical protein WA971_00945 [Microbacterium sp.]